MGMIPLPKGISGLEAFPKQREYFINLMPVGSGVIRTPGIKALGFGVGVCRGAVTWLADGAAYQVSGNQLLKVHANGSVSELGEISGTQDVVFSQGQVNLVILVKGGKGYLYSGSEGLREITDPDFLPSVDADFIDGRHVLIPADGSPAIYSEIDQGGSIDPLAFFDAEELPDKNKCVINIQNQLYIGGGGSFEVFRTNIDPDAVFSRRTGARVDVGFVAGKVRYANTFAFLGQQREDGYQFYMMGSGNAEPFSSEPVAEILNNDYTQTELEACEAYRFEYKGHEILAFVLARHTLAFHSGSWFYLDSTVDGRISPWRVKGVCHAYGKYIVGDRYSENIGVLQDIPTEYGEDVEFELQTFIRSERSAHFSVGKLEIDCLTGQKITDETIGLSISRDGRLWSDYHYRSLGKTGDYKALPRWQPAGGIGSFENYCGIRLRSTADVQFGLEAIKYA